MFGLQSNFDQQIDRMELDKPMLATVKRTFMDQSRIGEFGICMFMLAVSLMMHVLPSSLREIPYIEIPLNSSYNFYALDPSLNGKLHTEQVPIWLLLVFSIGVPLIVHFSVKSVGCLRAVHTPNDTNNFLLCLLLSISISAIITGFVKQLTGRLRPNFYALCGWDNSIPWDGKTNLCTSYGEVDARKSFPSGHSSNAFAGLFLATIYLLGKITIGAIHLKAIPAGFRLLKLFACFLPTLLALWIAITRSVDLWHHFADIVAGSLIGIASASFAYCYNYNSIYDVQYAGIPRDGVTIYAQQLAMQSKLFENNTDAASVDCFRPLAIRTYENEVFRSSMQSRDSIPTSSHSQP